MEAVRSIPTITMYYFDLTVHLLLMLQSFVSVCRLIVFLAFVVLTLILVTHGFSLLLFQVYGMLMARSTYEGMKLANEQKRPFVLTRAGFVGSQRYAATWTGDNLSTWEHLHMSISMVVQLVSFRHYLAVNSRTFSYYVLMKFLCLCCLHASIITLAFFKFNKKENCDVSFLNIHTRHV